MGWGQGRSTVTETPGPGSTWGEVSKYIQDYTSVVTVGEGTERTRDPHGVGAGDSWVVRSTGTGTDSPESSTGSLSRSSSHPRGVDEGLGGRWRATETSTRPSGTPGVPHPVEG